MAHVIYNGTPSLPHTFDYVPHGTEPVLLSFSGTAWTGVTNSKIGLELVINGALVSTAAVWSNGASEHRALHTALTTYTFPFVVNEDTGVVAPVSITIRAISGTNFDVNDYVTIAHV